MKRTIYTYCSLLLVAALLPGTTSCTGRCGTDDESRLSYIDTRVGTAPSATHTAGLFGKNTEEYGQTLPAVLEPNGMNFWTAQTRDTEQKCIAPYYYADSLLQGFRNSHWVVGGCTQDYGSVTLMPPLRHTALSAGRTFHPFLACRGNSDSRLLWGFSTG